MMAKAWLYGFHAVATRLRVAPESIAEIYFDAKREDARMRDLVKSAGDRGVRTIAVEAARIDAMVRGARHQGVVASAAEVVPRHRSLDECLDALSEPPLLLALDGITDPHNLGACLRVADAAGVHAVIAPKDRAVGLTATVSKVASGAAETIPYFTVTNLARELEGLKERGIWVIGAAEEATTDLFSAELDAGMAWVLGAEGAGLRRLTRERCDTLIRIPMFGRVESLNVSVAAGVCLFETRRRRLASEAKKPL